MNYSSSTQEIKEGKIQELYIYIFKPNLCLNRTILGKKMDKQYSKHKN